MTISTNELRSPDAVRLTHSSNSRTRCTASSGPLTRPRKLGAFSTHHIHLFYLRYRPRLSCHLVSGGGTTCDALWKPVTSIPCRGRLWNNKNSSEEMRESCISEDCHEGGDGAGSLHIRALQAVKNVREQLEEVMVDLELLIDRSAIPARMNLAGLVEMRINGRKSEANDDRNRMRSSDATFSPAGDLERNQSPLQCAFPSSRTTTRESPFLFPLPERSRRTNDADAGGIARSG